MCVDRNFDYKIVGSMTTATGNLLECVKIEIWMEKNKSVVSCIYRGPGSNIETFKE